MSADTVRAYQLQSCHVALPPQVRLHVWSHGRQQVVCVHQDVDPTVDHGREIGCHRDTPHEVALQ